MEVSKAHPEKCDPVSLQMGVFGTASITVLEHKSRPQDSRKGEKSNLYCINSPKPLDLPCDSDLYMSFGGFLCRRGPLLDDLHGSDSSRQDFISMASHTKPKKELV